MTGAEFVARLDRARQTGPHQWQASCPTGRHVHGDRDPSLTVTQTADKILVHCHRDGSCPAEDIVAAMGLTMADLFLTEHNGRASGEEIGRFDYHDERGTPLYQIRGRRRSPTEKAFAAFHPDPTSPDGWAPGLNGARRVLYRLPQLINRAEDVPVFVVEGEKHCDRLGALGLTATTAPFGAGGWRQEYGESLRDADVAILPDLDEPGRRHGEQVAQALQGIARTIRIVELPGLPPRGDVLDWLGGGHTADELRDLVAATPPRAATTPAGAATVAVEALIVRRASTITPRPIQWRWRRRLAARRYHELVGFPGIGKTALVMDMIARLTTGAGWPDGEPCEAVDVVIVAAEDEAEDVLVPRLIAAGADLERVHFVDGIRRGEHLDELDLSRAFDFAEVLRIVAETQAGMIYIDALDDVLGAKHDGKGNAETRRALAPVRRLARQTGATVLGLRHPTKRVAPGPALNSGNGSIAYGAVSRASLLVTVDPDDPEIRLLLAMKSNISRRAPTLRFQLVSEGEDGPPRICWLRGADPRTADDVLAALRMKEQHNPNEAEEEISKVDRAAALLHGWLGTEWLPVPELERLARQQDVSAKTLRRAKERLGLQYKREGFGRGSCLVCALPGIQYSPTSRDMGRYAWQKSPPGAEPVGTGAASGDSHTRPSHTRPSEESASRASMEDLPGTACMTCGTEGSIDGACPKCDPAAWVAAWTAEYGEAHGGLCDSV